MPPTHVINLDRSTERFRLFQQRNGHLGNVIRFTAVDGAAIDREELIRLGYINADLPYAAGTLGCAMSHVKLWEKAANENVIVTVFEDDTISNFNFDEASTKILASQPEFDVIIWGYNFQTCYQWIDYGFAVAKLHFYEDRASSDLTAFQQSKAAPALLKVAHSLGLAAYSISPKGARALLQYALPLRKRVIGFPHTGQIFEDRGIDLTMCGLYRSMQAFMCMPPLVMMDNAAESERRELDRA